MYIHSIYIYYIITYIYYIITCIIIDTIPSSIGSLSSLLVLSLYMNEINGTIPTSISMLSMLSVLVISDNHLNSKYIYVVYVIVYSIYVVLCCYICIYTYIHIIQAHSHLSCMQ